MIKILYVSDENRTNRYVFVVNTCLLFPKLNDSIFDFRTQKAYTEIWHGDTKLFTLFGNHVDEIKEFVNNDSMMVLELVAK